MRRRPKILLAVLLLAGCGGPGEPEAAKPTAGAAAPGANRKISTPQPGAVADPAAGPPSLAEATARLRRRSWRRTRTRERPPEPPPDVFRLVHYDSPAGKLAAYLTPDPGDGAKHPAIVWITGGDCNTIDELWQEAPRDNDQTAAAYRKGRCHHDASSLRGGNDNPGAPRRLLRRSG